MAQIPDRLFFRIGDVADIADVKPYVLRYWESEFAAIAPRKSSSGQRVYRRTDVETVLMIKQLLHVERYSIEGAKKRISELRKEGELRSFRQEYAKGGQSGSVDARVLKTLAKELASLAQKPAKDLFHY